MKLKKMLIVEDDLLFQKMLLRIFKDEYEVDFSESTEEYYEKYSNKYYDIMIIDISLKGRKSGLDLIKEIKAKPSDTRTPIICLTANALVKTRKTATEAGADLFITKPVPNKELKSAVELLIKTK